MSLNKETNPNENLSKKKFMKTYNWGFKDADQ